MHKNLTMLGLIAGGVVMASLMSYGVAWEVEHAANAVIAYYHTHHIGTTHAMHHNNVGDMGSFGRLGLGLWGGVIVHAPPSQMIQGAQITLTAPTSPTASGGQTGANYWIGLGNAHFLQAGVTTDTWGHTVQDDVWIQAWNPQGQIWLNQQSGAIAPGTPLQVVLRPTLTDTQERAQVINRATQKVLLSATVPLPVAGGWHRAEWIAEPLSTDNHWHRATQGLILATPSEKVPFTAAAEVSQHWVPVPPASRLFRHWTETEPVAALEPPRAESAGGVIFLGAVPVLRGRITTPGHGVFWTPPQPQGEGPHDFYVMSARTGPIPVYDTGIWITAHSPLNTDWDHWDETHPGLGAAVRDMWPRLRWRTIPWWRRIGMVIHGVFHRMREWI